MTSNPCVPDLYALYASKNRLCALCENTTPELTAYNAYRNANRRVRRAEGLKMYAVGNAYRLHTKCIQSAYKHIRRSKERILPSYFFFILSVLLSSTARVYRQSNFSLPASSGIPRRTMNDFLLPVIANSRLLWAFIARLTGRPPLFRLILASRSSRVSAGVYAFRPFRRLRRSDGRSKICMHCMHQKTDYALYVRTQLRN